MENISEQLKAELGFSPLLDSILLQFDKEILLATAHILPLPLNDVFFTCYYIHGMRHLAGQKYIDTNTKISYTLTFEETKLNHKNYKELKIRKL